MGIFFKSKKKQFHKIPIEGKYYDFTQLHELDCLFNYPLNEQNVQYDGQSSFLPSAIVT